MFDLRAVHAIIVIQALEDGRCSDRGRGHIAELARSVHAHVRGSNIRGMVPGALFTALDQVVHPVVLEGIAVRVEAFRFGYQLDFLIVVGCSAVSGNDSSLEVRVLEVGTTVVNRRLLLALLAVALALLLGRGVLKDRSTGITNQVVALLARISSTLRLQWSYLARIYSSLRQ